MCGDCDWEELLEQIDEALEDLEEMPDTRDAIDFGISVEANLKGIKETINKNKHATDRQRTAVENMHEGIQKWLGNQEGE